MVFLLPMSQFASNLLSKLLFDALRFLLFTKSPFGWKLQFSGTIFWSSVKKKHFLNVSLYFYIPISFSGSAGPASNVNKKTHFYSVLTAVLDKTRYRSGMVPSLIFLWSFVFGWSRDSHDRISPKNWLPLWNCEYFLLKTEKLEKNLILPF